VTNELKHVSRAIAVDNLTAIVSNLAEIRQNLANIEQDTGRYYKTGQINFRYYHLLYSVLDFSSEVDKRDAHTHTVGSITHLIELALCVFIFRTVCSRLKGSCWIDAHPSPFVRISGSSTISTRFQSIFNFKR
jgi:hypothetical protein